MVRAKRGDFHGLIAKHDVHEFESATDDAGTAKHRANLLGCRVGGDVVVLGVAAQQQIANRAADDETLVTGTVQSFTHADGGIGKLLPANAVLVASVNSLLGRNRLSRLSGAKYFFNEFLDHVVSLSCRNNRPAVLFGMCAQTVVGVNGDRVANGFHEGKVVV